MSSIQIGRVVTGGKLHLVAHGSTRCPVASTRVIAIPAKTSAVTPETVCGHCRRSANLVRIEQANAKLASVAIDNMLARIRPASTLSTAGYNPEYDAERAAIAADWAAQAAPVSPRTLAEMRAVNLRTLPQPTEPARYVNKAA